MFLWNFPLLVIYSLACLGVGTWLFRLGGLRGVLSASPLTGRLVLRFLLGAGVLGNVWLGLSMLPGGWLRWWGVASLVLLGLLGCGGARGDLRSAWRGWRGEVDRLIRRESWAWRVLAGGVVVLGVLYFLSSVLPPKSDAAAFYSSLPKLMAYSGELVTVPGWRFYMTIGLHGELHAAALMCLGGEQAATMFVFVMAAATAGALAATGRLCGLGARGVWAVLAMLVSSSAVTNVIPGGKVDLFGTALGMGAIYASMLADRTRSAGLLAGLLTGFAVVAKLSLLGVVVPIVGLLVVWRVLAGRAERRANGLAATLGLCLLGGVAGVAVHLVKNVLLFGNPLVPFVGTGEEQWLPEALLNDPAMLARLGWQWPVAVVFGKYPGMFGTMTAAALALWPTVLLLGRPGRWSRSGLVQISLVGAVGMALWWGMQLGNFSLRYFLPALLVMLLAPARGAEAVWNSTRRAGWLKIAVAVVLGLALAERINRSRANPGEAVGYIVGALDEADVGDYYARLAEAVNSRARPGERVYVATYYNYFLDAPLLMTASNTADRKTLKALPTQAQRWRWIYQQGFRWVMVGSEVLRPRPGGDVGVIRWEVKLDPQAVPDDLRLQEVYREADRKHDRLFLLYELRQTENND